MGRTARIHPPPTLEPLMPEQEDIDRAVAELRAAGLRPGAQPSVDALALARSYARTRRARLTTAQRARRRVWWLAAGFAAAALALALLATLVLA